MPELSIENYNGIPVRVVNVDERRLFERLAIISAIIVDVSAVAGGLCKIIFQTPDYFIETTEYGFILLCVLVGIPWFVSSIALLIISGVER